MSSILNVPSLSSFSSYESPDLDTSSDDDTLYAAHESQLVPTSDNNKDTKRSIDDDFIFNPNEELVVINSKKIFNAKDTLRSYLESRLSTDYSAIIKSQNFSTIIRSKQIEISENRLINECLILLSGCKLSTMFSYENAEFHFNHKFRLKYLNQVLDDCLKPICYYSKIVLKIREFISTCTNHHEKETTPPQVYEVFAQCLNEYLKYFNKQLGIIGDVLVKKELTFTLIDFIEYLKTPYFTHLDIIKELLDQINNDTHKENCEKSINLIVKLHRQLIDSYSTQQKTHSKRCVFLVWLFMNLLKFHLKSIENLLKEGLLLDTKTEFGFKRNSEIEIHDANYWINGYTFLFKNVNYLQALPLFMRVLVINTFKLCKYIQIIKLFNNTELNIESNLYDKFRAYFENIFPFLGTAADDASEATISTVDDTVKQQKYANLLELNFKKIKINLKLAEGLNNTSQTTLDTLFNDNDFSDDKTFNLNIETDLDNFISNSLAVYIDLISNVLIKNLINNYHLFSYIEHLQSYSLFKTNELMFLFSKNLFELIKFYETYQDEMILNKVLYHSSSNLVSTSKVSEEVLNYQKLFKIVYEGSNNVNKIISKSPVRQHRAMNISTRLINGIKLKFYLNWPYNLIVKEADVEIYNKFFILILQMKQVKYDLDSLDFKDLDADKNEYKTEVATDDDSEEETSVNRHAIKKMFLMRFKLINFINTIHDLLCHQIYQLSDEFQQSLKKSNDIDEILDLHKKFLLKMNTNSLNQNKYFSNALLQIFDFILRYCDRWRRGIYAITNDLVNEYEQEMSNHFLFMSNLLSAAINRNQLIHLQPLIAVLLYTAIK